LLAALAYVGSRHQAGISTVAIAYMLQQPAVAAAIVGARTARHLDQTLSVFSLQLDNEDTMKIQNVLKDATAVEGPVYGVERDRNGPHGRIMKYNLNAK